MTIADDVKLSDLVEMIKGTHMYINKKYLYLTDITFSFREETGCERQIKIGIKSSELI